MNTRYDGDGQVVGHSVTCNSCGCEARQGATYQKARLNAETDDWHSDGGSGYECPKCQRHTHGRGGAMAGEKRGCHICGGKRVKDLTQGLGPDRHIYCLDCKGHHYKGRWVTRKQWDIEAG